MATTRERLLDAALRAFATRGVDGTAITDLEADAGLAPGSGGFYRYFRTKDEVLVAAVDREIQRIEAEGRRAEPTGELSPREAFAHHVVVALETLDAHAELMAVLSREPTRVGELAARIQANLLHGGTSHGGEMSALLAGGGDDGAAAERAREAGAITMSAMIGYHLIGRSFGTTPGALDREGFAAALAAALVPES